MNTTLTPEQRSMRSRIAAYARWAKESGRENAERGQRGLREKFLRQAAEQYPDLPEREIARRAEALYQQHMTRLAFASSKARAARKRREGK